MERPLPEHSETSFHPHVGWLRHDRDEEVISLLRQGYFEAGEQAFFWLYLRPGDTFIDGGAHIGLYSVIAQRAMEGRGQIIAIEPSENTAAHLRANLEQNGATQARVMPAALWKSAGSIGFVKEKAGRAAYARVAFEGAEADISVPVVTLSKVIAESKAQTVALVKIDVEGAEFEALKGARRAVTKGAAPLLMVEIAEHNLRRRGLTTDDLVAEIKAMGYSLFEFAPETLQLEPFCEEGPIWFKNVFACSDSKRVNARLKAASSERKMIARDILGRAAACSRFKELEELDRLRIVAEQADGSRLWAERAEQWLSAEKETSNQLRASVSDAESRLAKLQSEIAVTVQLANDNRSWAERSDELLATQKSITTDLESRLANESKAAADHHAWAQRSDKLVNAQKAITADLEARLARESKDAAGHRARAERNAELLTAQEAIASELESRLARESKATADHRAWAERSDNLLITQKSITTDLESRLARESKATADHRAWAERSDKLLTTQKSITTDLESRLASESKAAADYRAWAERSDTLLNAQKAITADLEARLAAEGQAVADLRARAERTEEMLSKEASRADQSEKKVAEQAAEIERVNAELVPLQVFARRLSWIYGLLGDRKRR